MLLAIMPRRAGHWYACLHNLTQVVYLQGLPHEFSHLTRHPQAP